MIKELNNLNEFNNIIMIINYVYKMNFIIFYYHLNYKGIIIKPIKNKLLFILLIRYFVKKK
jgi:hypothetical protein